MLTPNKVPNTTIMKIPNVILNEPYRLFFPLGWLMGIVGSSYWVLVSTGLIVSYAPFYHGVIQIELFCSAFAVGFLLTALPKFLRTKSATNGELLCLLVAYLWLAAATLSNALLVAQWSFIFFISLLIRFAIIRVKERKSMPPFSFFLVAFGLFEGMLGALLVIYPSSTFPLLGQKLLAQGMFLSLSLGIGSFLGPRLMGVVDTENAMISLPGRGSNNLRWYRSPGNVVCAIGAIIFASFFIETGWHREVGLYLRAGAAFFCLARFNLLKIPRSQSVTGIFVAIALWSTALGILMAALLPRHEVGALHFTYIGGFGLLILTIGAQVVSSHGGIHRFWQIHKLGAIFIVSLMSVSALVRMSATFYPSHYFLLIGTAALAFDLAMIGWGIGVLKHVASTAEIRGTALAKPNL